MDWGFQDDTVVLWHAIDENRRVVTYRELVVNRTGPVEIGELIVKNTRKDEKISHFYLGHDAFSGRTSPLTIAQQVGQSLTVGGIPLPTLADTDRVGGWQLMYQMLHRDKWKISKECPVLIESLPLLQHDPKKVNDIAESSMDHAPDAARYGLKSFVGVIRVPIEDQVRQMVQKSGSVDPTICMMQERIWRAKLKRSHRTRGRVKHRGGSLNQTNASAWYKD
jgi:hypothetical protein